MMHAKTKRLIQAAKDQYRHVQKDVRDQIIATGHAPDSAMAKVQYAQNTVRPALEAAFDMMMPFDHSAVGELAIRLASYAISILPLEDQDFVVAQFVANFADAHMQRVAQGIAIRADWQMQDGRMMPNIDSDGDVR